VQVPPVPDFEAFVVARSRSLLRAAYLLTGNRADAEDLVQSALAKVAPRWARVVAAGDPEPYVRTVLHREHVSMWRRHRSPEVPLEEGTSTPDCCTSTRRRPQSCRGSRPVASAWMSP